jgi:hypothetical protein
MDPAGQRKAGFDAALPATQELEDNAPLENWAHLVGRTDMQRLDGLPLLKTCEPKLLQAGKRLLCRGRHRPLGPGMVDRSGTVIIINQDQLSFFRKAKLDMSVAHDKPSSGGTFP